MVILWFYITCVRLLSRLRATGPAHQAVEHAPDEETLTEANGLNDEDSQHVSGGPAPAWEQNKNLSLNP